MKNIFFFLLFSCYCINLYSAKHTLKFNLDRINNSEIRYTLIPDHNSTVAQSIFFPHFIPSNYFQISTDKFVKKVRGYDEGGNTIQIQKSNGRYLSLDTVAYYEIDISKNIRLKDLKPSLHPMFEKNKFVSLALSVISPVFASKDSIVIKVKYDFSDKVKIDSFLVTGEDLWKYNIARSKYINKVDINSKSIMICANRKEYDEGGHTSFISTSITEIIDHLGVNLPDHFTIFLDYDDNIFKSKHALPNSEIYQNGMIILVNSNLNEVEQKEQILRALAWQLYRYMMPIQLNDDRLKNVDPLFGHHSMHLWWYESVTEYLSLTALVGTKLIEEDYFRQIILKKIVRAIQEPKYSLIQLANDYSSQNEKVRTCKNLKSYSAFHNRGILASMMLDISLLKESRGENGLNYEFMKIIEDGTQIQSTLFINNLTKNKGELFKQTLEHYILGIEVIAFESMLKLIDWQFFRKGEEHKTFIKGGYVSYFPEIEHYLCIKKGKNTVGLEKGDILLSVNGQKRFNLFDLNEIVFGGPNLRNEGRVKIEVLRNGQNILLRGLADMDIKIKEYTIMPLFQPDSEAYQRRIKLLQLK